MTEHFASSRVLWQIVSSHYALLVTATYLFAAIVGASYYVLLFNYFGLSVFDYWDTSDLLLAAFRQPLSIILGIVAMSLVLMMLYEDEYNAWLRSKGDWWWKLLGNYVTRRLKWRWSSRPVLAILFGVFWFLVVTMGVAFSDAKNIYKGRTDPVEVRAGDEVLQGHVIAATSRYVILLRAGAAPDERIAVALPLEAVQSLRQCAERGGFLRAMLRGRVCVDDETEEAGDDIVSEEHSA